MAQPIAHDALAMIDYSHRPSILALADSDAGLERARRAVAALGYRLSATAPLAGAAERVDLQVRMDGVFVDVEEDAPPGFDRLLDRLQAGAEAGNFGSVIATPASLIDQVAARAWHERVEHLCEPSDTGRIAALAFVAAPRPERLHDGRREQAPVRLQQLSEEVGRIATILASLSADDEAGTSMRPRGEAQAGTIDAGEVRAIIRARRLRDQYFKTDLFADPAWDMLLDLTAARLERQRVAVSSLCIAAAVPATTALRWIKTLTDYGVFIRIADPQDGRRVYIELSDKAAAGMEAYLKAARRISPLII